MGARGFRGETVGGHGTRTEVKAVSPINAWVGQRGGVVRSMPPLSVTQHRSIGRTPQGGGGGTGRKNRVVQPTNQPTPSPKHPPKKVIRLQGDRGLKIKKTIGGLFCPAKYLFYEGLDIQYHALGYATRMTPKRVYWPAPAIDLTTSLLGDLAYFRWIH